MANDAYKRGIITEELLSITEDFRAAIILRQFLYWLPRMAYVDEYVEEVVGDSDAKSNGWVYKSAQEMADETMCGSRMTVARRIESLVEAGYLDKRGSNREMDTTNEYRVNPLAIERDLREQGYTLFSVVRGKHRPIFERLMANLEDDQHEHPSLHRVISRVNTMSTPLHRVIIPRVRIMRGRAQRLLQRLRHRERTRARKIAPFHPACRIDRGARYDDNGRRIGTLYFATDPLSKVSFED